MLLNKLHSYHATFFPLLECLHLLIKHLPNNLLGTKVCPYSILCCFYIEVHLIYMNRNTSSISTHWNATLLSIQSSTILGLLSSKYNYKNLIIKLTYITTNSLMCKNKYLYNLYICICMYIYMYMWHCMQFEQQGRFHRAAKKVY